MSVCRRAGGGRNVQHRLVGLLRQSVYSRLAGYEDTNDAERLAQDPTMRVVVGRRDTDRSAASTNTMSRFETEVLTQDGNVEGLGRVNATWVDRAMTHTAHRRVILDMDSSDSIQPIGRLKLCGRYSRLLRSCATMSTHSNSLSGSTPPSATHTPTTLTS